MEASESTVWIALGFVPTMAFMEISFRIGRKKIIKGKAKLSSMTSSSLPPMAEMWENDI
jgi:hypothetical protein